MEGQPVQGQVKQEPVPADPFGGPPSSPSLSRGLSQLSIDAPVDTSAQGTKTNTNLVAGGRTPSRPSSRRASGTPQSPRSPMLSRKSSNPAFQQRDLGGSPRPVARRITSTTYSPRSAHVSNVPAQSIEPERKPHTAASVACDYLQKDLIHHIASGYATDTTVIVHDSCYGHRYSRPKTSKAILGLIVERPERLQAGVLGIASAYVRTGKRYAGGANHAAPHPNHEPDASTIPFRIQKSSRRVPLTSSVVTAVHGTKWMQDLKLMCDAAETRLASGEKELSRPETATGASSEAPLLHEGDLYLCPQSLEAFESALGGTLDAVDAVFQPTSSSGSSRKAFACVRPPGHHCSAEMPSGFCWINNVHVGIEHATQQYGLTHAAIIDFDLHHGDGSQAITWERNVKATKPQKGPAKNAAAGKKSSIGYFSLHDINSYPCEDGDIDKVQRASVCVDNAHAQSIWNVHLQSWATVEEFWKLYETRYLVLLSKARDFLKLHTRRLKTATTAAQPKAAIFLSAGFDASEWETQSMRRHKVNVPTEFYARFTLDVIKLAAEEGTSVDGRIVSVLEGGYSDRALTSGVFSHIAGLTCKYPPSAATEAKSQETDVFATVSPESRTWDAQWWSRPALEELEKQQQPQAPPPAPTKKVRNSEMPTYTSPTQSFSAKVVDPTKIYRTTSGSTQPAPISRAPSPPPPEVDWATSAFELSKLLIPSDRQINSCRHDELNVPRPKRERHSSVGLPSTDAIGDRMQLRGRRAKAEGEAAAGTAIRTSQSNRRRTLSDLSSIGGDVREVNGRPSIPNSNASARPSTAGTDKSFSGKETSSKNPARPRSSVSTTSEAAPLKVNRTRRASGSKTTLGDNAAQTSASLPPVPKIPQEHATKTEGQPGDGGVDALTSGVKKITLKMSQDDGTSQKKPARKLPGPKAPKTTVVKPAAPSTKSTKTTKLQNGKPGASAATVPVTSVVQSIAPSEVTSQNKDGATAQVPTSASTASGPAAHGQGPALSTAKGVDVTRDTVVPANSTVISDNHTPWQAQDPPLMTNESGRNGQQSSHEFVAFQPPPQEREEKAKPSNFEQGEIQWLPPNSGTPAHLGAAKRGKENLPVFSASGHIPFAIGMSGGVAGSASEQSTAPSSEAGTQEMAAETPRSEKQEGSVWDVPVTPQR